MAIVKTTEGHGDGKNMRNISMPMCSLANVLHSPEKLCVPFAKTFRSQRTQKVCERMTYNFSSHLIFFFIMSLCSFVENTKVP